MTVIVVRTVTGVEVEIVVHVVVCVVAVVVLVRTVAGVVCTA